MRMKEYKVQVPNDYTEEITRERDPNDEWDNDDTRRDYSFTGTLLPATGYWDFILTEEPKNGSLFYLVCVYYDTGDSFHRCANVMVMIGLYKAMEDAMTVKSAIEADSTNKDDDCSRNINVVLPMSKKKEFINTRTWKGYFDRFSHVEIETLTYKGD